MFLPIPYAPRRATPERVEELAQFYTLGRRAQGETPFDEGEGVHLKGDLPRLLYRIFGLSDKGTPLPHFTRVQKASYMKGVFPSISEDERQALIRFYLAPSE